MAEVSAGGSGSLQVHRDSLRQAAGQAGEISQAVAVLAAEVSPACSSAVSAHPGWRLAGALSAMVPGWKRYLGQQAQAVSEAGGKLSRSADTYADVENNLVARVQAINLGMGR
jgi:hypothetical protein